MKQNLGDAIRWLATLGAQIGANCFRLKVGVDITPTLYAETVILKPLPVSAVKQYVVDWLNDPEVVRFSELRHRTHSLERERAYVRMFDGERAHLWGIYASDKHIGNTSAHIDTHNNVTNIGILIGEKSAWRKGYGRQAWKAVCDWLLDKNGGAVRKVEAGCMKENLGMKRIFETTGMFPEGERLGHFLLDGRPVSEALYGRWR